MMLGGRGIVEASIIRVKICGPGKKFYHIYKFVDEISDSHLSTGTPVLLIL